MQMMSINQPLEDQYILYTISTYTKYIQIYLQNIDLKGQKCQFHRFDT